MASSNAPATGEYFRCSVGCLRCFSRTVEVNSLSSADEPVDCDYMKVRNTLILFWLGALVGATGGIAWAEGGIYKWVDDQGKIHYGDRPRSKRAEKVKIDHTRKKQIGSSEDHPSTSSEDRRKVLDARLQRARRTGRSESLAIERRAASASKKRAAEAPQRPDSEELWRKKAIASCQSGGFRKNCESEEQIQKRRPVPQQRRDHRRKKRKR